MRFDNPINKRIVELALTTELSYGEISDKLNAENPNQYLTREKVRDRLRRKASKLGMSNEEFRKCKFNEILALNNMAEHTWKHGWLKVDGASIFVKNQNGEPVTYFDIRDQLIEDMKGYAPKYKKIKRSKNKTGHLLVIDPADVHFGKLSRSEETGYDYDLKIAEKRFSEGIDGLIDKASRFNIGSIILVLGNDILHVDNTKRTTTSGTPQDTDGMWWEGYKIAKQCYIQAIEKLTQIADVLLVFCPSNHDFTHGFMLADAVNSHFYNNKHVTCHSGEVNPIHNKYITFGANVLGFTHGDGAKHRDLPSAMLSEAGVAWNKGYMGYWYVHHIHHKDKKMYAIGNKKVVKKEKDTTFDITEIETGVTLKPKKHIVVESVRTPSAPDRWHYTNGYKNLQAMEAFLHHPLGGQVARFTHYF